MRNFSSALLMSAAFFCAAGPQGMAATPQPAVPGAGARLASPAPQVTTPPGTQPMTPAAAPTTATTTTTAAADPAPASSLDIPEPDVAPIIGATAAAPQDPDDADGIAATVNDQSISDYEVRQRMALFIATSGIKPDAEAKARIRTQVIEQLENEKIELAEALKKHITVSPSEIDKSINRLLGENHFTIDQLRNTLGGAGTSEAAMRAQILAQIAWQKTVQDEYGDRPVVTPEQVEAEMARYAEGADKPHFLVGEIFLPVDNPEQDAKVLKDAQNIESQLALGAPFPSVARQFSQSPSAAGGGDMGWVHEGQLAPELNATLVKMTAGSFSQPIRGIGGYYILTLRERQEPMGTKIVQSAANQAPNPEGTLPLARLLLPLGAQATREEAEQVVKIAASIRAQVTACEQLDTFHAKLPGSIYMNLGETKISDLAPDIQKSLAATHSGDVAMPVMSDAGIEIIARCDKKVIVQTAFTMPDRKQVEENLFDQQISIMARRYLRDLKREANIQVRDEHGNMQVASKVR